MAQAELIEDYQLQVEHVTDLLERNAVRSDADVLLCPCTVPPFLREIAAAHDHSYTSHAMSPFALLHTYRQVYGTEAPPSFLLRIRGYGFELGASLSDEERQPIRRMRPRRFVNGWPLPLVRE